MTMSIGGLVSGMDTASLISQLIQAEAAPQAALKTRLSLAEAAASAYRSVNSRFDALRTAAEAVLKPETWTAVKATSTATNVAASATAGAPTGSLTFDVTNTATTHSIVSGGNWTATTDLYGMTSPIEVRATDGTVKGTITVGGDGTLADAVTAINASEFGLGATAVKGSDGKYRLQVTAKTTGAAAGFDLGTAGTFAVSTQGLDAKLTIGSGTTAYDVVSSTNTFADVMSGVTITVSKPETAVTVQVAADPGAAGKAMQSLVDAANRALSGIKANTDPKGGTTSTLKGDSALRALSGRVLDAVSFAVGADGSPATIGLQLNKDGTIAFDAAKFTAALADQPALAQRLGAGGAAGPGADGISGNADDVVPGVAQRLLDIATTASDTTTGSLVLLAKGRDSQAEDIQDKIEAWDLRLVKRREILTRQFTAMETALSSLQQQSSWLAGQIASLPSYS
ncbi:flagellar filament capping protein FliD [Blastococcus capsensis]|uniref:flagellar filament capping protein FliD n=1 Tax=Blastococcus capsensis TaxID=1564163 RepID=UPI00254031F1|nr:flagellar filament capping protein FliD [Blastococcus capsensis]MDK3257416.1 flagellar filament capping protein FliD [Blastococcus capsensis]